MCHISLKKEKQNLQENKKMDIKEFVKKEYEADKQYDMFANAVLKEEVKEEQVVNFD